jgi:hypothetical protein
MELLPIEDASWLGCFKARIRLENEIICRLIQWGFTESAFDIYKKIEERFNEALELQPYPQSVSFRLPEEQKTQIREVLRAQYLKTREFPRRRSCQQLLHLTGFEPLSSQLVQLYERHLRCAAQIPANEKSA